VLLTIDV